MSGNIEINQSKIKKNHVNVRVGNKIKIIKNNLSQEVEILQLTKRRISPKEVDKFYIMHSCSISTTYIKTQNDMLKNKTQRIGKLNKKERREINKFKEKNNFE